MASLDATQMTLLAMTCWKGPIDLLAILQKRLDRASCLYIFIHDIRSSGVMAILLVLYRFENSTNVAKYRSILILFRIAKRSMNIPTKLENQNHLLLMYLS